MKACDIAQQLARGLTPQVNNFTNNANITSLTAVGTTVTAQTASPHGLSAGHAVTVTGAVTPIQIDTFTRNGTVGTIVTQSDHDATKYQNNPGVPEFADVSGANETEFNGMFKVTAVLNRRTIEVEMTDSGPTAATGTVWLNNATNVCAGYNGLFNVIDVPDPSTFTYETEVEPPSDAMGSPELRSFARIVTAADMNRIIDMYENEPPEDYWLYVALDDVVASKRRDEPTDAGANIQRSNEFRQQILQSVTVYLVIPSSDELSGGDARDVAEEMFGPICKSILFKRFEPELSSGLNNPLQFVSHGFAVYNTAYYMHGYTFQQIADLQFNDTVGYDTDVAFRDISLSTINSIGTGSIDSEIDLDQEPLTP